MDLRAAGWGVYVRSSGRGWSSIPAARDLVNRCIFHYFPYILGTDFRHRARVHQRAGWCTVKKSFSSSAIHTTFCPPRDLRQSTPRDLRAARYPLGRVDCRKWVGGFCVDRTSYVILDLAFLHRVSVQQQHGPPVEQNITNITLFFMRTFA